MKKTCSCHCADLCGAVADESVQQPDHLPCCEGCEDKGICKTSGTALKYVDSRPQGETISRIITDVEQFSDGLLMGFSQFFTGIVTILGTLVFMLGIHVQIALVVILITPVSFCFVASFLFAKKKRIRCF